MGTFKQKKSKQKKINNTPRNVRKIKKEETKIIRMQFSDRTLDQCGQSPKFLAQSREIKKLPMRKKKSLMQLGSVKTRKQNSK